MSNNFDLLWKKIVLNSFEWSLDTPQEKVIVNFSKFLSEEG